MALKPLKNNPPSETGFYRFDGTPIQVKDKIFYESRGVVFTPHPEGDLMPDGERLKCKRFRSDANYDRKFQPRTVRSVMGQEEFEKNFKKWEKEYNSIEQKEGEVKPSFSDWFAQKYDIMLTKVELANALLSSRVSQSARAVSSIREHTKAKPKAQIEVSAPEQEQHELSGEELLLLAFEANGIDKSHAFEILRKINRVRDKEAAIQ